MILMPIWGGNETLCKARAIENQIPLVISSYDLRSAIYDQAGEAKAIAPKDDKASCVVYADLNLAEPMNWKWTGNWRDRIWLEGPGAQSDGEQAKRCVGGESGGASESPIEPARILDRRRGWRFARVCSVADAPARRVAAQ